MTTPTTMEERFEEKFPKTQNEATHFDDCICWSCNDYREEVLSFIQSEIDLAKEEERKEIVDNLKKFFENEHPVDCIDGVTPVETYGYEKTHNNALQLAINLITKK